jgi:RNA polymerase sigma-B factor
VQVASLGLVKAVDRFDVERETSFTSFAVPVILGELRRHFRDASWAMRVPRPLQERIMEIDHATERLRGALGRSPTPAELAAATDRSVEEVSEALAAAAARSVASLDGPAGSEAEDGETRIERIGDEDPGYDLVEFRSTMAGAMSALSDRDRAVLGMRFLEDRTQSEIADRLGVSQMSISRTLRRVTTRLQLVADAS